MPPVSAVQMSQYQVVEPSLMQRELERVRLLEVVGCQTIHLDIKHMRINVDTQEWKLTLGSNEILRNQLWQACLIIAEIDTHSLCQRSGGTVE